MAAGPFSLTAISTVARSDGEAYGRCSQGGLIRRAAVRDRQRSDFMLNGNMLDGPRLMIISDAISRH